MRGLHESALENLEVADALSPLDDMDNIEYRASLNAHAEGTLSVMREETSQFGQLIKTPAQLQKFLVKEKEKASLSMFNKQQDKVT